MPLPFTEDQLGETFFVPCKGVKVVMNGGPVGTMENRCEVEFKKIRDYRTRTHEFRFFNENVEFLMNIKRMDNNVAKLDYCLARMTDLPLLISFDWWVTFSGKTLTGSVTVHLDEDEGEAYGELPDIPIPEDEEEELTMDCNVCATVPENYPNADEIHELLHKIFLLSRTRTRFNPNRKRAEAQRKVEAAPQKEAEKAEEKEESEDGDCDKSRLSMSASSFEHLEMPSDEDDCDSDESLLDRSGELGSLDKMANLSVLKGLDDDPQTPEGAEKEAEAAEAKEAAEDDSASVATAQEPEDVATAQEPEDGNASVATAVEPEDGDVAVATAQEPEDDRASIATAQEPEDANASVATAREPENGSVSVATATEEAAQTEEAQKDEDERSVASGYTPWDQYEQEPEERMSVPPRVFDVPYPDLPDVPYTVLFHAYNLIQLLLAKEEDTLTLSTELDSKLELKCSKTLLTLLSPEFEAYFKKAKVNDSKIHYQCVTGKVLTQVVEFINTGNVGPFENVGDMARLMIFAHCAKIPMLTREVLREANNAETFPRFVATIRKICSNKYLKGIHAEFADHLTPENFYSVYSLMSELSSPRETEWCVEYFRDVGAEDRKRILESAEWKKDDISELIEDLL